MEGGIMYRIIAEVRNGKSKLYYCQIDRTYWKTLKSCKVLGPPGQRVRNPKKLDPRWKEPVQ